MSGQRLLRLKVFFARPARPASITTGSDLVARGRTEFEWRITPHIGGHLVKFQRILTRSPHALVRSSVTCVLSPV